MRATELIALESRLTDTTEITRTHETREMTLQSWMGISYEWLDPEEKCLGAHQLTVPMLTGQWDLVAEVYEMLHRIRLDDIRRYVIFAQSGDRWCPLDHVITPDGVRTAPHLGIVRQVLPGGMRWVMETDPCPTYWRRVGMAMLPTWAEVLYHLPQRQVECAVVMDRHIARMPIIDNTQIGAA